MPDEMPRDSNRKRRKIRRILKSFGIVTLVTILVAIAAMLAYAWYVDHNNTSAEVLQLTLPKQAVAPQLTAPKPASNGPVGVAIEMLTSPVKPGMAASVSIRTLPGAACTIKVTYNNQPSTDSGLVAKNADDYGAAQWSWTVENGRPTGKWPVEITCSLDKRSGYARGDLVVG